MYVYGVGSAIVGRAVGTRADISRESSASVSTFSFWVAPINSLSLLLFCAVTLFYSFDIILPLECVSRSAIFLFTYLLAHIIFRGRSVLFTMPVVVSLYDCIDVL